MTGLEMGAIPMTLVGTPDVVAANARTGIYAMRIDADGEGCYTNLGATLTEMYCRVAFRPSVAPADFPGAIVTLANSDGENMLMLGLVADSLTVAAFSAGGPYSWTQLDVGSTLVLNTWYVLEVRATTPADTGGVLQMKVDGVLDIDFSGDTLGAYEPANFRLVGLGNAGLTGATYQVAAQGLYDDFAVNDTAGAVNNSWPGRGGIEALVPTGAGATTGLTPSAGANWDCVDEVPASDADYVGAETVDLFDTYGLSDTVQTGGVPAVCVWLRAALAEAGAGNVATMVRASAANYTGSDLGIDTTFKYVSQIYETNPAGGVWTTAALDGIEAGTKVR